jgi:hypothetical protein
LKNIQMHPIALSVDQSCTFADPCYGPAVQVRSCGWRRHCAILLAKY